MIIVLASLAGAAGFLAGPVALQSARRSLGPDLALLHRDDWGTALGANGPRWAWRPIAARVVLAAVSAGTVVTIGGRFVLPAYLWFVAVTALLTITDIEEKLIPNRVTLPGGLIGAALLAGGALLDGDPERILWAAIGAGGYFVFMFILALLVPGGLGFGDVKLAPILGGFVAAEHLGYVAVAAIGAYVIGGITSAVLLITRVKSRKDTIPFGPYMVAAAYVALFAGGAIVDWYLN